MKLLTPVITASQAMVPIAEICGISSIQFDSIGVTVNCLLKLVQFQVGIPCMQSEGGSGERNGHQYINGMR